MQERRPIQRSRTYLGGQIVFYRRRCTIDVSCGTCHKTEKRSFSPVRQGFLASSTSRSATQAKAVAPLSGETKQKPASSSLVSRAVLLSRSRALVGSRSLRRIELRSRAVWPSSLNRL